MSDAGLSDDEVNNVATPGDDVEAPRDTVEENGLGEDEDEDDLFGDGGDDAEEPA